MGYPPPTFSPYCLPPASRYIQATKLVSGCELLVATPGRLLDFVEVTCPVRQIVKSYFPTLYASKFFRVIHIHNLISFSFLGYFTVSIFHTPFFLGSFRFCITKSSAKNIPFKISGRYIFHCKKRAAVWSAAWSDAPGPHDPRHP